MIDHIWLHQRAAVGDRRKCICQFQVADALCQTAECCRESLILAYEGSDSQPFGIFDTELRRYRVRHAAQGDDVHGIGNAVADRVIALVIAAPPVSELFFTGRGWPVIVNS